MSGEVCISNAKSLSYRILLNLLLIYDSTDLLEIPWNAIFVTNFH